MVCAALGELGRQHRDCAVVNRKRCGYLLKDFRQQTCASLCEGQLLPGQVPQAMWEFDIHQTFKARRSKLHLWLESEFWVKLKIDSLVKIRPELLFVQKHNWSQMQTAVWRLVVPVTFWSQFCQQNGRKRWMHYRYLFRTVCQYEDALIRRIYKV